jgi:colanic acid biosynthesis protein WcaH
MIPESKYASIIEVLPILCVDIMIQNPDGEYLLIQRAREPLKGEWWVIGGRVLKGETLVEATIRKIKDETNLDIKDVKLAGYYEDTNETNRFGHLFPQHSVSVVFSAYFDGNQDIKLDYQSSSWKFSKELPPKFNKVLIESLI